MSLGRAGTGVSSLLRLRSLHTSTSGPKDVFGDLPISLPRRVVVTGLGLVTPLGVGVTQSWEELLKGACGIRSLLASHFPKDQQKAFPALPAKVGAKVCAEALETAREAYGIKRNSAHSPFVEYALLAAAEALKDANWQPQANHDRQRTGVAIGSGMSATAELAAAGMEIATGSTRRLSPFLVPRILANTAAGAVSMRHQLLGPNHCVSTACTTGAHAVGDAFNFVRHGFAEVMVAGASEACLDAISIGGFSRMRALETRCNDNPGASSRPFDAGRGGFVMGEGAGMLVLEELTHALARQAPIYAEVRGYGLSADAHHITQPAPDGSGAVLAMRRALDGGGIRPEQINYVNAHATSTPMGDAVEAAAIASVFSLNRTQPTSTGVVVSSTKGATGHLLGAAGAVEAAFSVLALKYSIAPGTLNLENEQPLLLGSALIANRSAALPDGEKAVLSNSFGFGGTNASLLFASGPSA